MHAVDPPPNIADRAANRTRVPIFRQSAGAPAVFPSSQDLPPRGAARQHVTLPTDIVNLHAMPSLAADLDLFQEFHGDHAPFLCCARRGD